MITEWPLVKKQKLLYMCTLKTVITFDKMK